MSDPIQLSDPDVIEGRVCEDSDGNFGLFLVPLKDAEICITEDELRTALAMIVEMKGEG